MATHGLDIAFFGSSLLSALWNGAATYYRGVLRALADLGHRATFYEPDAFGRQQNRDMEEPPWARVVVYGADGEDEVRRALDQARSADVIVKASGVGVFDELLEEAVAGMGGPGRITVFWDVDAPATLDRVAADAGDSFRRLIPSYDLVLTYGGGPPVVEAYRELGARACHPIYNAVDPDTHHPVPPEPRFRGCLSFLGNRLPDREERVDEFLLRPARSLPERRFLLGGSGWDDRDLPGNVQPIGHVPTRDHNAFNTTPMAVLNVNRESMARWGWSPATRVFEAAGAGACLISDAWRGLEDFLEPGREVLVAEDGDAVAEHLESLAPERSRRIGAAAQARVVSEHTYRHRAGEVEALLTGDRMTGAA